MITLESRSESFYKAIIEDIDKAKSELEEGENLVIEAILGDDVLTVERIAYSACNLIRLCGKDLSGNDSGILCHINQFALRIKYLKTGTTREIGFGAEEYRRKPN